jgi:hypothetical protein
MPLLKKTTPTKTETKTPPPGSKSNPVKGPAKDAFAQKLAETEAAEGGNWVPPPPGSYNALVTEGQGEVDGDKTTAYLEFTLVEEDNDAVHGKTCRIYFNFTDENGEDKGGMPYFRQAMTMFGIDVEAEINNWEDMCAKLAELAEEQAWCVVDVKKKGKYTNIYLSSVPEDQSEKPVNPNE